MLSFDWNAIYETTPADGLSRGSIDDVIRQISRGVRQRMSREHNFGYTSEKDDGTHRPGKTTVASKSSTVNPTDADTGSLHFYSSGTVRQLKLKKPDDTWTTLSENKHSTLVGTTTSTGHDDVYVRNDQDFSDVAVTVNMGGNKLYAMEDYSPLGAKVMTTRNHLPEIVHTIASVDQSVRETTLTPNKISSGNVYILTFSGSLSMYSGQRWDLPGFMRTLVGIEFSGSSPNLVLGCYTQNGSLNANIAVYNYASSAQTFTLKLRIIA